MGGEHSNIMPLGQCAIWAQSTMKRHSSSMHSNACVLFCLQTQPRSRECRDVNLEERLAPRSTVRITASMQSYVWNRTYTLVLEVAIWNLTLNACKITAVLLSSVSFLKTTSLLTGTGIASRSTSLPKMTAYGHSHDWLLHASPALPSSAAALPALPTWHS